MSSDFGITAKRSFAPALRFSLPVFPPPQAAIAIAMVTRAVQIRLIHFSSRTENAATKARRHEERWPRRHRDTEALDPFGGRRDATRTVGLGPMHEQYDRAKFAHRS